jgi:DNA repair protein RecO (recombination protein O)
VDVLETSRVLTLFSRDLGKVVALAKGARRLKSPFQSSLDLLSVCDIVVLRKDGASDSLDLLTEAVLIERYALTDPHDPHPKLFDAAVITLRHLDEPFLRPRRVMRFELACLRELGLMPALEDCVHCGANVNVSVENDRVAVGLATGGVLCAACRPGQPHVATLSGQTLDVLRRHASPGNSWRDANLDPRALAATRGTLGAILGHLMGRRPRLWPYLGT